jgi:hypothetical protein
VTVPKTCICAECGYHPGDDLGRIYCDAHTTNPDGVCNDCRVYWSKAELKEARKELA